MKTTAASMSKSALLCLLIPITPFMPLHHIIKVRLALVLCKFFDSRCISKYPNNIAINMFFHILLRKQCNGLMFYHSLALLVPIDLRSEVI